MDMKTFEESGNSKGGLGKQEDQQKLVNIDTRSWQFFNAHKYVLLWSAFMGLAGINWGLDVMVIL